MSEYSSIKKKIKHLGYFLTTSNKVLFLNEREIFKVLF